MTSFEYRCAIVDPDSLLRRDGTLYYGMCVRGQRVSAQQAREAHIRGERVRMVEVPVLRIPPDSPKTSN